MGFSSSTPALALPITTPQRASVLTFQNPLLNQLLRPWPILQTLLQTIGPHMPLQLVLLLLQRRRRRAVVQDILLHQLLLLRPLLQPLAQVVCDALALELRLLGLQRWRRRGVEEDVPVFEVLFFGAVLGEMLVGVRGGGEVVGGHLELFF